MFNIKKKVGRIDVMEAARVSILSDIKRLMNANNSDDEVDAEKDEDYMDMAIAKRGKNVKRSDSD
jgi:hypothetical protein